jgi:hypothetical protein
VDDTTGSLILLDKVTINEKLGAYQIIWASQGMVALFIILELKMGKYPK